MTSRKGELGAPFSWASLLAVCKAVTCRVVERSSGQVSETSRDNDPAPFEHLKPRLHHLLVFHSQI